MDKELINKFLADIVNDYETYGLRDWLIGAIKRHIVGVDDAKAKEIADEIFEGRKIYLETAAKSLEKDPMDIINEKLGPNKGLSPDEIQQIEQETRFVAETAVKDIKECVEEVRQNEQEK